MVHIGVLTGERRHSMLVSLKMDHTAGQSLDGVQAS